MIYWNNKELRKWLRQGGWGAYALLPFFALHGERHKSMIETVAQQHPDLKKPAARAAYRLITMHKRPPRLELGKVLRFVWMVAVLFLLLKISGYAQQSVNIDRAGGVKVTASGVPVTQPTGTNLHIVCDSGCGGAASFTDASAFSFGTTSINNISAVVDDIATNTVAENSAGAVRMNANRILYIDLSKTLANTNKFLVTADPITFASPQHVIADASSAVIGHVIADSGSTTTVTGNVAVTNAGLTNLDVALSTRTKPADQQHTIVDSGTLTAVTAITNALPAGSNLLGKTGFDTTTPGTTNAVSLYQPARTTGTLTSTTCPGTGCVSLAVAGYGVATVTQNGTYSLTTIFEFSDDGGTTWYTTTCTRSDSSTQETGGGALVNVSRAWDCSVYAASNFRVRATSFTSGTANLGITLSAAPIEAAPTVGLAAGSNVVGHVIADTGSTTAVTQTTGTNLHAVLDTTSTTAVTQATGTNLHAVLDTTSTTAATQATGTNLHTVTDATSVTTATLNAETTKVIGTVRATGNIGGVMDTTQNATQTANNLSIGCAFTTTPNTITTGNQGAANCNNKGELLTQLTDGTTNVAVIAGTTALKTDLSSVAGTAASTAASGVLKVGVVGNAGAIVDAANAASVPANVVMAGTYEAANSGRIIQCDKTAKADIATATTTSLVAVSGSTSVYVCSFTIEIQGVVTTAGTLVLETGTGAACTSPVAITPPFVGSTIAGQPMVITQGSSLGYVIKGAASSGLCALSTTTTPQKVFISYAQF